MFCKNLHIYITNQLYFYCFNNNINDTKKIQDEFSKKYLLKVIVFCELFTFDILKAGCYNTDEVE